MTARGAGDRYETILNLLGQGIIDGAFPVGSVLPTEQIQEDQHVSRTVVREATRTLSTLGLVKAQRNVGTTVLPPSDWATTHPMVIRWRAHGPDFLIQHHELLELRLGVEPVAAELSARRAPVDTGAKLMEHAAQMGAALRAASPEGFFEADSLFHKALLEGSGNAILAKQAGPVAAGLHARFESGQEHLRRLIQDSVDRHVFLAEAVALGDTLMARRWAEMLIRYTLAEVRPARPQAAEVHDGSAAGG
ncbi:MAG: FCD domain-containing protein [Propionibacteriaceae bacterium]|jgi:DNA-binding FadR family transcriptional regulator|nr:FCD domain-containing protein [Propionibacteriaceae bacterium]